MPVVLAFPSKYPRADLGVPGVLPDLNADGAQHERLALVPKNAAHHVDRKDVRVGASAADESLSYRVQSKLWWDAALVLKAAVLAQEVARPHVGLGPAHASDTCQSIHLPALAESPQPYDAVRMLQKSVSPASGGDCLEEGKPVPERPVMSVSCNGGHVHIMILTPAPPAVYGR